MLLSLPSSAHLLSPSQTADKTRDVVGGVLHLVFILPAAEFLTALYLPGSLQWIVFGGLVFAFAKLFDKLYFYPSLDCFPLATESIVGKHVFNHTRIVSAG